MIKSSIEKSLKGFICFSLIILFACQSTNAMFRDDDGEEIERSAWKKYICCCWPPSKEETANHYFRKGTRLWNETYFRKEAAKNAMEKAALNGHQNAPAMLKNIEDYNPIVTGVRLVSTGYSIYSGGKQIFGEKKTQ